MKKMLTVLLAFLFIQGCLQQEEGSESMELMGVQALLWTQFSAEAEALYIQAYNLASSSLMNYKQTNESLRPAVTLDIDETVLDNSPFNAHLLQNGLKYSEEYWQEWCERREALPLPGALSFTKLADSLGIEVFYVSNRKVNVLDATIENLVMHGFPNADSLHVLLKTDTSSKDERREKIRTTHDIILLLGDNLGDFDGLFDDRSNEYGKTLVRDYRDEFAKRFVVFPNPIYGSWERAVFPEGIPTEKEVLKILRSY